MKFRVSPPLHHVQDVPVVTWLSLFELSVVQSDCDKAKQILTYCREVDGQNKR